MKDTQDQQTTDAFPRRRGRPRKYASDAERVRAYRNRKREAAPEEGGKRRLDVSLDVKTAWVLQDVAKARGVTPAALIEELVKASELPKAWHDLDAAS